MYAAISYLRNKNVNWANKKSKYLYKNKYKIKI